MLKLIIGNRNYSSWSLRAWLYMRASGLEFGVHRIPMFTATWEDEVKHYSSAGRVPVLLDGDWTVWDSLAIIDHLMEHHAPAVGWPEDPAARAQARSVTAEMHSGFIALRSELPQNIRARNPLSMDSLSPACRAQVARVIDLWTGARTAYADQGPWLFGGFSIADVFYAPVALRFVSYGIPVPPPAQQFSDAVQELEAVREWCAAAADEPERLDFIDNLTAADQAPLTIG